MKKYVSVLFCLVLMLSVLTGCGRSSVNDVSPDHNDMNRPGVNDTVNDNDDGMVNDSGTANPNAADNSVMDNIEDGVDHAGDAVQRGMDRIGDAAKNAADDMTNR